MTHLNVKRFLCEFQVEGLLEGEDFAAKVSRDEYLDLVKDLLARVTKPVEDALKASEITMVRG